MARFYERYGYAIVLLLTFILGAALSYWSLVYLATHGLLPPWLSYHIGIVHAFVSYAVESLVQFIEKRIQWIGAFVTLGTFAFGLVSGIRQSKRQLPQRLAKFMSEQLAPVYEDTERIVAAVAYRSVNVPYGAQLFRKAPLNQALDALGDPFRPRRRRSLDEAIAEVGTYIAVTEKRLKYLQDIRAHARILRGAVRSSESPTSGARDLIQSGEIIEADFGAAIDNETTRLAALELRGLFRARLGNLPGALQDFIELEIHSKRALDTRAQARALRHQADIRRSQAAGSNLRLLRDARRNLNDASRLITDRGTLGPDDWLELGHNRESYGEVQAAIATIAGANMQNAERAFNSALVHFQRLGAAAQQDCQRVHQRIQQL